MITRKEGLVFVVSAPSGAGKTTLCKAITDSLGNLRHSISYTTRRARPGEKDGRDYFFVPEEKFRGMVRAGDFAEFRAALQGWDAQLKPSAFKPFFAASASSGSARLLAKSLR